MKRQEGFNIDLIISEFLQNLAPLTSLYKQGHKVRRAFERMSAIDAESRFSLRERSEMHLSAISKGSLQEPRIGPECKLGLLSRFKYDLQAFVWC